MRCCVPDCKNDSRHMSKSEGITFHVFPTEQTLRHSWLRALGRESWKPKEQSAVCSQHFLTEDLYETKSGLRKVKSGAMPHINQDSSDLDFGKPANVKVCRICLAMDNKLYPMKKYKLEPAYEQLTGLSLATWSRLPAHLCTECSTRALNWSQFRTKSLRAHTILTEILHKHDQLTVQNIKSIDREANQLITNLSAHKIPDLNTILVNHEEKDHIKDHIKDIDVKRTEPPSLHEVNIAIDEVQVKNEEEQNAFFEENNYAESLKEEDVNDEINDDALDDDDFVASDHNSSSCDSLPINQLKKTKRKEEKTKKKKKVAKPKEIKKVRKKAVKKDPNEPKIDRRRKPFLNEDLNETLFTITDLSFEEQIAEIEKRQESSNYKNSVYKCTSCFKGFLDEDAYESHVVRHTDACGDHACKICKTHFKQPHALRKHITAHHTHRFSCNNCSYVTTHRQTARLHERWHKGTKYQCPHCQDEFLKFTTYMGHIRIKHPSQFVCELCGYSFVSAKGIELHKKLKHRLENIPIPEDGPYCETCNVKFVSEEAHRRHLQVSGRHAEDSKGPREANKPKKSRKPREPKVQRDRSPKQKRDSSERRLYPSQMRRAEGPIPCEQCGLQLEDSRAYHGHFRRMHPDKNRTNYPSMKSPCMCEVCGRMFQSYALLKDHTWTHTGEKPFKCELCSKSFRMKQRLVAHRRVHSQQRATYVCGVCGKHFSTHSNRQRHMFIHTGLKPFKCEMCGKGFKHASEKRAHVTYVHLKKPWPKRARSKRGKEHGYDRQDQPETEDTPREGVREMEIAPLWPCDPKMPDMTHMLEDKPHYYNLKI